ncbi:response regulator [Allopusillimonas ginsengisoli]|uniref:response regulator n=1 Tax=Allopusillimonas ginsengisoli TaxID=453575 RepID=UPI0039C07320
MENLVLRDINSTVLVVDDEVELRWLLADFLSQVGFHVLQAGTADDAIRKLQNGAVVHIVFSDVNMPETMDGIALARWLRENRPEIKVVLASGQVQPDTAELYDGGAILKKPFHLHAMASRLLNVCRA